MESRKTALTILFAKQKQRHRHGEQTYGFQAGRGGGMNWGIGVDTCVHCYVQNT